MRAPVVVILAAGQGTRMRSAKPKLAHELCGRPLLAWTVAAAREARAGQIVVVDGPERRLAQIAGEGVEIAIQAEQRGTADALAAAAANIDGADTVLVLNGDTPLIGGRTLVRLAEEHLRSGAGATMLTAVLEDPAGYGRVVRAPDGTVERVVETKTVGDAGAAELRIREVNTGVFAFDAAALLEALARVGSDNAQGERYLPDVLPLLRARERTVCAIEVEDPHEVLGVNDRVQLAVVRQIAQRRILERHMRAGVTIVDPASTVVDVEVQLEADSTIAPFSALHGVTKVGAGASLGPNVRVSNSSVGEGAIVGPGSTVSDSTVGEGAVVGPGSTVIESAVGRGARIIHSYLTGARVHANVSVGPFAYLRPGTVMREGSKAGTFVEIKNSDIGAGSKVPHLSYVGDAEIGEQTNLGAATITANYDGVRKHRTRIGSRVRTSVDTTLVAPVSIGDDAYTAAGSVITADVPAGALGVARCRQTNVEGYARRRREREARRQQEDDDRRESGSEGRRGDGGRADGGGAEG